MRGVRSAVFFFFSSRRRHTRFSRDWSSDVCSSDLLEYDAVKRLNDGIQLCIAQNDGGSRELAEKILSDEEHHIDWLEAQLHAIGEMGYQNYLAQQLKKEED